VLPEVSETRLGDGEDSKSDPSEVSRSRDDEVLDSGDDADSGGMAWGSLASTRENFDSCTMTGAGEDVGQDSEKESAYVPLQG